MASNGKKKTTMAKLQREQRMREKRMDKQARKEARKREAAQPVATLTEDPESVDVLGSADMPTDADADAGSD
ncbi:hypothetical protein [Paraconexibacter sp.]|uniref:hypothetical protein n=1 Tax=Paraconexibacter sp. TaxID=2949640 RepID=UPI003566EB6D